MFSQGARVKSRWVVASVTGCAVALSLFAAGARAATADEGWYLGAGVGSWRTTPAGAIRSRDYKLIEFFEDNRLELYNLKADLSETNNLAAKYPEKLEALKKLWDEQAWKNNVYPLNDDVGNRVAKQFKRAFGDRKTFTYYAPGAERIPEAVSAPIKDKSHAIETTLDLTGKEAVVVRQGRGSLAAVGLD